MEMCVGIMVMFGEKTLIMVLHGLCGLFSVSLPDGDLMELLRTDLVVSRKV